MAGLALLAFGGCAHASDCDAQLAAPDRQQTQGAGYTLVFTPNVWPVPVGHHFNLVLVVCPPTGVAALASVAVDADMPTHRHGMNYRTTVRARGDGQFAVEGLMFHMPGRWRFIFDIATDTQVVRITHEVDVQ